MRSSLIYSSEDFSESLTASFIGSDKEPDERYSPRIISNSKETNDDVLSVIKNELAHCESFDFSVAFVTSGGIQTLVEILLELQKKRIPGRILTSTYLDFNEPEALRKLTEFTNIETRVYQGNLHAKGYFFDKNGISTIIIGSSNLTQKALTCNKEWNVLFRSFPNGKMLKETKNEFEKLWTDKDTTVIDEVWIREYAGHRSEIKATLAKTNYVKPFNRSRQNVIQDNQCEIVPNEMQKHALEALSVLHRRKEPRALLISATGTGKTYLSALDVISKKPKKVLFVAHRQRILEASLDSYKKVLGNHYSYGFLGDSSSEETTCLFAMVIQLAGRLNEFKPDEFDYIVIDEAHRTGANSYQKIIDYFVPKFILGMTATPTRTDGYDVYKLFNHVIAYRITLGDALKNGMLTPFHYFGIADLVIDDNNVEDFALFSQLTSEARVNHIVKKIEEYSVNKEDRRGLVFCSRNEEAQKLSILFNQQGYKTIAISGASSDEERNAAILNLEQGKLQYIFSVDILNEGVDIPSLNQIIMLRKTESAIVFVQQLGRGLRKDASKEFTLVLDFIGNYQENYLIPIALSGDRTYNKDNLRRVVKEGSSIIPGCSTISFDKISEKRIFQALEEGRFSNTKLIKEEYKDLRRLLGRIPSLLDFDANESIDPLLIIGKFGSYPAFLQRHENEWQVTFSKQKSDYLKFLSVKLASGKRISELLLLQELIDLYLKEKGVTLSVSSLSDETNSAVRFLTGEFSTRGQKIIVNNDGRLSFSDGFFSALEDDIFLRSIEDVVEFGLRRNQNYYSILYKDTNFVLNKKYTREEICRLLRWKKEPNYQNVGGYFHDEETNTFPVFINYEKSSDISVTTQYHDRFINERKIICISKSGRKIDSKDIIKLKYAQEMGMRCFLFLRKNKNDKDNGTEFYFLGEMYPTGEFNQIVMADGKTNVVEITYILENPVRADLYDYFLSNLDVSEDVS